MAVVGAPLFNSRRTAMRGLFTIACQRGQFIARAWPRSHLARPKLTELARREWLANMVLATLYMDSYTAAQIEMDYSGSPTITRDFKTMMLAGTLYAGIQVGNKKYYPVKLRNKIWRALDAVLTSKEGLHVRHTARWISTGSGTAGQKFTSHGANQLPTWE